jgi:predicted HAD superfamily phosphohydrolase YqeG
MKQIVMNKPDLNENDFRIIIEFCSHPDNIELNLSSKIEIDNDNSIKKAIMLQDNKFLGYIQKKRNNLFFIRKDGIKSFILSNKEYDRVNKIVYDFFMGFEWKAESKEKLKKVLC